MPTYVCFMGVGYKGAQDFCISIHNCYNCLEVRKEINIICGIRTAEWKEKHIHILFNECIEDIFMSLP